MRQETEWTCGPAVVRRWLKDASRQDIDEAELALQLGTTESEGTKVWDLIRWACIEKLDFEIGTDPVKGSFMLVQVDDYGHWVYVVEEEPLIVWDPWTGQEHSGKDLNRRARIGDTWYYNLVVQFRELKT